MERRASEPGLFGSAQQTEILLAIYLLGETYPSELAHLLGRSVSRVQDAVRSFEMAGIVTTMPFAGSRRVELSNRYFARDELRALLQKLAIQDVELRQQLAQKRRRPRRMGKDL